MWNEICQECKELGYDKDPEIEERGEYMSKCELCGVCLAMELEDEAHANDR